MVSREFFGSGFFIKHLQCNPWSQRLTNYTVICFVSTIDKFDTRDNQGRSDLLFHEKTWDQKFLDTFQLRLELVSVLSTICREFVNLLLGPKHEIFGSRFITPSKPIWVGDFRTERKKFVVSACWMYFRRNPHLAHAEHALNVLSAWWACA